MFELIELMIDKVVAFVDVAIVVLAVGYLVSFVKKEK